MTDVVVFAVADVTLPTAPTCFLMMIGGGRFWKWLQEKGNGGGGYCVYEVGNEGRTDLGMSHFP